MGWWKVSMLEVRQAMKALFLILGDESVLDYCENL